MLRQVVLSDKALKHIRDELAYGDVIAESLLQYINFEQGIIYTFLPDDVKDIESLDFRDSVSKNYQAMYGETHKIIAEFIKTYLSQHKNGIVVFETLASPNDTFLKYKEPQYFSNQQKVYLYLVNENADVQEANEIISGARGYPCIGILSSLPRGETIQTQQIVNDNFLQQLVVETEHIIIGAFDQDGFLFWSKNHE